MERLGKYQRITIPTGQGNTLDRIIGGFQQLSRLGDTEGGEELLRRHSQIILEQCI